MSDGKSRSIQLTLVGILLAFILVAPGTCYAKEEVEKPKGSIAAKAEESKKDDPKTGAPKGWMKDVDDKFEIYLVNPLGAVLFYDFGSGDVKDKEGNITHKGWAPTSLPFVVIWLLFGATFFTIKMGFINFRVFRHAIDLVRGKYDDPKEVGEVTHFQALASALSATVGLGNIAGVALAIGLGGPGATLWMILIGFLGMTSKFTECTLGQLYRKVAPDGTVSGGAMHYLKDGLTEMKMKPLGSFLGILFTVICIGASFGGGNAFQVGQSLDAVRADESMKEFLTHYSWVYGVVMAVLVGVVIIGGIKSIGAVAGKIVPVMCAAYVSMCLYILFVNFGEIPAAFQKIFEGAFNGKAAAGGVLGVMVIGIKRAVFSNEAGVGSAAIAHSAAKTDEPVSEGIVALLEPFIDTIVICTMTALVIIITGEYLTEDGIKLIDAESGAALTTMSVSGAKGVSWFRWVLYAAVIMFAYSTLISWSYYGERCWTHLFGERSSMLYKIIFLCFTILGSIVTNGNVMNFSDMLILGMAIPNILGLLFLSGKVKRELHSYLTRLKSGEIKKHK